MLTANKIDDFRYSMFAKLRHLITADGSKDSSITLEGLPEYDVPSLSLDASGAAP